MVSNNIDRDASIVILNMKIGALQPGYLPWLGFFEQVYRVEKFVIYDDVQFTKQDWRTRNRIKTSNGVLWLTVPTHGHQTDMINEVTIANEQKWAARYLSAIRHAYGKAEHYQWLFPELETILSKHCDFLVDLDVQLIEMLLRKVGITAEIILASDLCIQEPDKNLKIIRTIKTLRGDYFYEGQAGKDFVDTNLFEKNEITVEFQHYQHPVYSQLWGEFVPNLSAIDLLFNCGPESLDYIIGRKGVHR